MTIRVLTSRMMTFQILALGHSLRRRNHRLWCQSRSYDTKCRTAERGEMEKTLIDQLIDFRVVVPVQCHAKHCWLTTTVVRDALGREPRWRRNQPRANGECWAVGELKTFRHALVKLHQQYANLDFDTQRRTLLGPWIRAIQCTECRTSKVRCRIDRWLVAQSGFPWRVLRQPPRTPPNWMSSALMPYTQAWQDSAARDGGRRCADSTTNGRLMELSRGEISYAEKNTTPWSTCARQRAS